MAHIYSPYIRSVSALFTLPRHPLSTHPLRATTPPPPYEVNLTTLPTPILYHIFSHLSALHFSTLSKTSTSLRTIVLAYLAFRRQHRVARIRSLQTSVIAANLPNELLQEIFSYLLPLDFYNSTQVCSTWRHAASYSTLVREKVFAAQPPGTISPPGELETGLKTLSFYLQASGKLKNLSPPKLDYKVSTLYLNHPGRGTAYPEIHMSEDGHYFLAVETEYPWRIHVYSTYRPVLREDIKSWQRFPRHGRHRRCTEDSNSWEINLPGFHEWDTTPTHLLTLPETGRVMSASFGPAMYGGIKYDKKAQSYTKGLDLLVLFEGSWAKLYKIRENIRPIVKNEEMSQKSFGKWLFEWTTSWGSQEMRQKWRIWDSMKFFDEHSFQGPMIAKLGDSGRVIFATTSHLEVWENVCRSKSQELLLGERNMSRKRGDDVGTMWDKEAVTKSIYRIPVMSGRVAGVFTGAIWHTGLGEDVDYIICSNTPASPAEKLSGGQTKSMVEGIPYSMSGVTLLSLLSPEQKNRLTNSAITPTQSFGFDYTNLVRCQGYNGSQLFIGLTPNNTLSQVQLLPTPLNPEYKPYSLITRSVIPLPSTSSFFKPTNIAAVCRPGRSIHPIIIAATDSGEIYISIPPPCNISLQGFCSSPSTCPSSSTEFQKFVQVPLETGGRVTDLKVSFRGPVWDFPRRDKLHSNELKPIQNNGSLVVVVVTDRGRVEMCYFDLSKKGLRKARVGKKWDLCGEIVKIRE